MIPALRAIARALVLTVFLGLWLLLHLVGRLFTWTRASRLYWRRWYLRGGARVTLGVLGGRVHVEGRVPEHSSIVVCNHLGYVDILVLASVATVVFVSRSDVERWFGVGRLAASAGTIFLDRERRRSIPRTLDKMRASLTADGSVVFFPEGTSSDGRDLLPFRSSLFEVAAQMGAPVVCAALSYRTPPGQAPPEEAVAWWQEDLDFLPHFWRLLRLSKFEARLRFVEPALSVQTFDTRRALCAAAEQRVRNALHDLLQSAAECRA